MWNGKVKPLKNLQSLEYQEQQFPGLQTERLTLLLASPGHAKSAVEFVRRNQVHLAAWEPLTPPGFYERDYWEKLGRSAQNDFLAGVGLRLNLFIPANDSILIGRINFSQITREPFQSCMLGYAIDAQYQGKGLMHEGLTAAIDYMFTVQKLHRIQANYLPENQRSAAVLKRLDFKTEGLAQQYLFINGRWRDHILSARLNPLFAVDKSRLG